MDLMHNPGFDMDWTQKERAILSVGLVEFAACPLQDRYAMIAVRLPNKTVRDVALRCSWIRREEASKKRNKENNSKKANEKVPETPAYLNNPVHDQSQGLNEILIKDNEKLFTQITSNLAGLKVDDNPRLFSLIHVNILNILNSDAELMKSMPEFPVRMQEKYLAYFEHLNIKGH